jgi:pyruvate formate lyase activating enzyme
MFIGALEKMTLVDFPNKVACIVFLVNCNFRCPYCYNKELTAYKFFKKSKRELITEGEFFSFLNKNKKMLDGVVITGGEPTCSPGLILFMTKIKQLGFAIKFDTNGSNPNILKKIIEQNLAEYIAMDLKAPLNKYQEITRSKINPKNISDSISLIINSKISHEFRTTLYSKLNFDDFKEMNKLIPNELWYLQEMDPTNAYEPSVRKLKPMSKNKIDKIISVLNLSNNIKLRS